MPIPRLQLFELEDFPWFPSTIRDLATDYLHFMETRFALHKPVIPLLRDILQQSKAAGIVDLCSGGGGPVPAAREALRECGMDCPFTLTDKYPNLQAFRRHSALHPAGIFFAAQPVDATAVPRELAGLRTMFNAFHHFPPESARRVLGCAVEAGQPIAVFEIPERRIANILPLVFTPLFVALAPPAIRPFRWRRLLFTYLIPLVPVTCWWDGLVSQFRAYTVAEMLELTHGLDDYEWHSGRKAIGASPGHITWLSGIPKAIRHKP
jgi:hypothetical protein